MKKILLFSLLAVVLLIISGCENGLSHDKNGLNNDGKELTARNILNAAIDNVSGCILEEVHQHNDVYYSGHYNNDGHGHHGLAADDICVLPTCEITALHTHNGTYYSGHNSSCGHDGYGHHSGNSHHS